MESCCGPSDCGPKSCAPRQFLTKEEKLEMLSEYRDSLAKEVKGVEERIAALKKGQ